MTRSSPRLLASIVHDVAEGAQRGVQRRRELLRGQLGLFLVIVDVVVGDDIVLGCLPGLAGAQHDAHERVHAVLRGCV